MFISPSYERPTYFISIVWPTQVPKRQALNWTVKFKYWLFQLHYMIETKFQQLPHHSREGQTLQMKQRRHVKLDVRNPQMVTSKPKLPIQVECQCKLLSLWTENMNPTN